MVRIGSSVAACVLLATWPLDGGATVAARDVAVTATFNAGMLRVERFGRSDGRSIIFIPALACGSWQWNAQLNTLSRSDDVLVVTLPGLTADRW